MPDHQKLLVSFPVFFINNSPFHDKTSKAMIRPLSNSRCGMALQVFPSLHLIHYTDTDTGPARVSHNHCAYHAGRNSISPYQVGSTPGQQTGSCQHMPIITCWVAAITEKICAASFFNHAPYYYSVPVMAIRFIKPLNTAPISLAEL
jgi:hypothetical protein